MNEVWDLIGGRYRLLRLIAGTGRVWLADDELLRRRVALREIATPTDVGTAQMLDAQLGTMRRARAAARLEHPGVVGVFDVVWRPDCSWIVMEYVESRSLEAVVREDGPLPHQAVARIGQRALAALRVGHEAGVLHRDMQPRNVLLATDGRVVLTDFGLAEIENAEQGSAPPAFVAPERLRGGDESEAADLWSLGATLYAAVEGRPPRRATATEPAGAARFPGPLTPIIDELLTEDPAGRPAAADVQARLQLVLDHPAGVFPMRISRPRTPLPSGASALGMSMILDRMNRARPAGKSIARSTKAALVVAGVLLAGTAGTALALDHRPGATPVAQTSGGAAGPVVACAPGGPAVTGKPKTRGYAVPAGWLWHTDPTGFDVAVPKGWTRSQDGTTACFRDPGGSRSLRVNASARLSGPALAAWQKQEQDALAAGTLPGYRRVTMDVLPGKPGSAAWEFTWQPDGEPVRRHERRVLLSMGDGRSQLVEWTTPDQDWAGDEPYLELVLASLS